MSKLNFFRSIETPKIYGNGVAVALEKDNVPAETKHLFAYGAVRVELTAKLIVDRSKHPNPNDPQAKAKLPAAIVRTMLLFTAVNQNQPARVSVDIPIWSARDLSPGEVVDAAFSLDLISGLLPMELIPGSYSIYLIASSYLVGPYTLRVGPKA